MNDVDSDDESLDVSWITCQERTLNINNTYCKEYMESINLIFMFVNKDNNIDKIVQEKHTITNNVLSNSTILQIVQTNKKMNLIKYKLLDILTFFIDIEPDHIQTFDSSHNYLKTHSVTNDILLPESIFIFHELNAVYFIFQEYIVNTHKHTLKSILKKSSGVSKIKNTKKVRIDDSVMLNKTRKRVTV